MNHSDYPRKQFLKELLIKRRQIVAISDKPVKVSDALAAELYAVCQSVSRESRFREYPYIEDMVSEATIVCLQQVDKCSSCDELTIFAFFRTTASRIFLRVITSEEKHKDNKTAIAREQQNDVDVDDDS